MSTLSIVQTIALIITAVVAIVALVQNRLERSKELQRARLERLLDEIVHFTDAALRPAQVIGQGESLEIARLRLGAAIQAAGGPATWRQADILRRNAETARNQAEAALTEVTEALIAVNSERRPRLQLGMRITR